MDKLINYIEFRAKKYGVIKGIASPSSMYYQIGQNRVRVSDHMKYGELAAKENDFYFIIQPNDMYIFISSPKYVSTGKMYMKIVSYQEAKDFIKTMDDYAIQFSKLTNWYVPDDWNRSNKDCDFADKISWAEFEEKYMAGKTDEVKLGIINRIEAVVYGELKKGNFEIKYKTVEETYNLMTKSQYNALMAKMDSKK